MKHPIKTCGSYQLGKKAGSQRYRYVSNTLYKIHYRNVDKVTIQRKHHKMAVTVTDTLVNYCSDLVQGLTPFKIKKERSKVNTCNLARGTCILKEAMNHLVFTKDNVL